MFYKDQYGNIYQKISNLSKEKPQGLEEVIPNSADASVEKHMPTIKQKDGKINVSIGEVIHPMEDKHYINFIEQETENEIIIKFLKPGKNPSAEFENIPSNIYSYCNLHGLWKQEIR